MKAIGGLVKAKTRRERSFIVISSARRRWHWSRNCGRVAPGFRERGSSFFLRHHRSHGGRPRSLTAEHQIHPRIRQTRFEFSYTARLISLIQQERLKNLLIELIKIDSVSRKERDVALRLKREM